MTPSRRRISVLFLLIMLPATALAAAPATQPAAPEFLDGAAGRTAIIDDSMDPYFSKLEEHEMTAKTSAPITGDTHEARLAECKRRYQAAVLDFTRDDRQTLSWLVTKIEPPLTRDYPVFGKTPWSFIKIANTLEGGMAHTRGGHVILPEGILAQFNMIRRRAGDAWLPAGASLLIHEQTHVVEREHPALFEPFYTDTLHFIHAKKIADNAWLRDRQIVNPDGTVCDWVYPLTGDGHKTFILPLIAFEGTSPTTLQDGIGMIAVTVERVGDGFKPMLGADGNPLVRQLNDVPEYRDGPGAEQDNYHPNEITADRFSQLVVIDDLVDKKLLPADPDRAARMEAKLKPTRDWAIKAFAEPAGK